MSGVNEWIYPDIHSITGVEPSDCMSVVEDKDHDNDTTCLNLNIEKEALSRERISLKIVMNEYKDHIDYAKKLVIALEESHHCLDIKIKSILEKCVCALVAKIIHKKIETTPDVLTDMIDDVLSQLIPGEHPVSIRLSESDMKYHEKLRDDLVNICELDKSLNQGDIIIYTEHAILCSKLQDRINSFLCDGGET